MTVGQASIAPSWSGRYSCCVARGGRTVARLPTCRRSAAIAAGSTLLGGILAHAGIDGFLGNLEESYELGDDEAEQWGTFLGAWWTAEGDEPFSAADMLDVLRGGPAIAEAAPPAVGELLKVGVASPAAGLGGVLSREADRRYTWGKQQVYVTRAPRDTHAKKNRWRVVVEDFVQEELF